MKSLSKNHLALMLVYLWVTFLEEGLLGRRVMCNYVLCSLLAIAKFKRHGFK